MKHTILATIMLVALSFSAEAYDFQSGDLCYTITGRTSVEVTKDDSYSNLTSITLPDLVLYEGIAYAITGIGSNAFSNCSGLTSITITFTVKSIGSNAFSGCNNLAILNFQGKIDDWLKISFGNTEANPLSITHHLYIKNEEFTDLVIPDNITEIKSNAFYGCLGLTSVTIPNSVTSIGENAFTGCDNITTLTYNSNNIGLHFSRKSKLSTINIGDSVSSIHHFTFEGCSGLKSITIPNSVKAIGDYAFNGCSGLASVTIPNSVTSIGVGAFNGCSGLASVTIPNSVTSIGKYAFGNVKHIVYNGSATGSPWGAITMNGIIDGDLVYTNAQKDTLIAYIGTGGDVTIPNSVTSICSNAFSNCSGLTSITIPNSVTSIGSNAFSNCSGLTSVTFAENSKLTSIGYYVFDGCSGLTSITIPNSVTSIGSNAFSNCNGLTSVNFAENSQLTSIGNGAFIYCEGLTSVTIPNSTTSIGVNAFYNCHNLEKVDYRGTIGDWLNISFSHTYANPLYYAHKLYINNEEITNVVIPDTITEIKHYAFNGYSGLTSVTIPNSVKSIGDYAFAYSKLKSVIFAENSKLTSIGEYAFGGSSVLGSVTIPNSVTSIGNSAFKGIKHISYNGNATGSPWGARIVTKDAIADGDFVYTNDQKDSLLIYIGTDGNAIIPNSVTSIGEKAFYNCTNLTSVTIPNSVTSIGNYAFYGCSGLTSVIIPNSVTSISSFAFDGCSGLTSVTIPNSVTSIGYSAISDCSGLTSITIPNSVTSISDYAFDGCGGLTSITIPNSVTSIGNYAFRECTGLTSVSIPNSVTSIGNYAFIGCTGLTSVNIPNSVTSIGWSAFTGCTSSIFYCQATEKPSGWDVNWNIDSRPVVWGCKAVSLSANDNTFGTVSGDGLFPTDSSINITAISAKHYHFVKWSDGDTENPRTIKVTTDTTLIAVFAIDTLKVNTFAENGTVSGTGAYTYGTQTSLTATPAEHYHFAKWNDGNTENPRTIKVTADTTLIAMFAIDTLKVTASAENGTVLGAGLYAYGTSILLGAIPAEHYHFAKWNDGNIDNPRSINVTENIALEAIFKKADDIDTLKVTASAENGTVFGAGEFAYGTSILLVATPAEHYHFAKWSDGNTENPRTITVTEDITLEAIFEKADDISTDAVSALAIYAHHNVIVVENADADIYIYDAMGRLVARRDVARNVSTEITMQDAGIYIVKVGNEAKRVAVSQN